MPIEARYHEQVRLLVSLLTFLNDEPCFALKGGTAINLFVQPLPRRSVDIDLAYLPLEPRDEALRSCRGALQLLAERSASAERRTRDWLNTPTRIVTARNGRMVWITGKNGPIIRIAEFAS
ncbi:nucleotidyl transferase AbiEii/AbiGii toxin family protein [Halomonas sp. G11]|uniref:nucleotidyl transferase AbiEii/AbiGii toxin family protein n=1 Tax=Halomonas sp. G11 TaxID=1684425 RepID=UPI00080078BC|nr:nucleotidyl transferase AbiEii/AbiGii toxin family protein [Halomonas sp. G11]OAZ97063.1 hypothetical protein ADS46_17185 [Halomonas sp. G11]